MIRFDYFGWNVDADVKIQYVLDMFYELFDDTMSRSSTPISSSNALVPVEGGRRGGGGVGATLEAAKGNARWKPAKGVGTRLQMDREHMLHFLLTVQQLGNTHAFLFFYEMVIVLRTTSITRITMTMI